MNLPFRRKERKGAQIQKERERKKPKTQKTLSADNWFGEIADFFYSIHGLFVDLASDIEDIPYIGEYLAHPFEDLADFWYGVYVEFFHLSYWLDEIGASWDDLWDNIKDEVTNTWDWLEKSWDDMWDKIKSEIDGWDDFWDKIKEYAEDKVTDTWDWLEESWDDMWDKIKEEINDWDDFWDKVKEYAEEAAGEITLPDWIPTSWEDFKEKLTDTWGSITDSKSDLVDWISSALKTKFNILNHSWEEVLEAIEAAKTTFPTTTLANNIVIQNALSLSDAFASRTEGFKIVGWTEPPYTCFICGKIFNDDEEFITHMAEHLTAYEELNT